MEQKFFNEIKGKGTFLPNIKKIFIPDKGMEIMDADLSGADAYTYFLDSQCKNGIEFLTNPQGKGKLAAWVASNHLQREITPDDFEYRPYKASHHGWWYGMEISKLAATIGCSYSKAAELDEFYKYFYPERDAWHRKLLQDVRKRGYIENSFGRRFWFLDTNDPTLKNKIFAAIPQSTTAEVINRGWKNIRQKLNPKLLEEFYLSGNVWYNFENPGLAINLKPEVKILLQVHDSLVMQYPERLAEMLRPSIIEHMLIPLDYEPSVCIPVDYKVSSVSYGDCEKPKKVEK